jgi:hypothetical protein
MHPGRSGCTTWELVSLLDTEVSGIESRSEQGMKGDYCNAHSASVNNGGEPHQGYYVEDIKYVDCDGLSVV